MRSSNEVMIFKDENIRAKWDEKKERWFFSIIDVLAILTESENPRKYWSVLKTRLKKEGSQLTTNCSQLKLLASDGKYYFTDVADTEQLFRLIQSVPSKKAEPFKIWLAKVGYERVEENQDPELTINRAMQTYIQKGYSKEWVNQRLKSIEIRKELTDEWSRIGIERKSDFAILTDVLTKEWSEKTVKEYKKFKNLKKEGLRDNMTNLELVLNMLAEATTKEISKKENPNTFSESKDIARKGGNVAKNTRLDIENKLGEKIVSSKNAIDLLEDKEDKKKIFNKCIK